MDDHIEPDDGGVVWQFDDGAPDRVGALGSGEGTVEGAGDVDYQRERFIATR